MSQTNDSSANSFDSSANPNQTTAPADAMKQPTIRPEPGISKVIYKPVGYMSGPPTLEIAPEDAHRDIESRPQPSEVWRPQTAQAAGVKSLLAASLPAPNSVGDLARALRNSVDNIFEHIYENYEFYATYGSMKSPVDVIESKAGNAFDLSKLMVELIRAGGGTASYQLGTLQMTEAQAIAWLGVINFSGVYSVLINGGVPFTYSWDGTQYILEVSHVWVKAFVAGNNYIFDVTNKSYTVKPAIDLQAATGFNTTTFLNRAVAGATITSDYVQGINRNNIRADLTTAAMALADNIKTNTPAAEVQDIVGGREVVPLTSVVRDLQHPLLKPATTPTEWIGDIDNAYKSTMRLQYPGFDVTMYPSDISHERLTLFFNGSMQPELKVGGQLAGTGQTQFPNSWNSLLTTITHPTAAPFTSSRYMTIYANRQYSLLNMWGKTPQSRTEAHADTLRKIAVTGASNVSEEFLGEDLRRTGDLYGSIANAHHELINRISKTTTLPFHLIGNVSEGLPAGEPENLTIWEGSAPTASADGDVADGEAGGKQVAQTGSQAEKEAMKAKKKDEEEPCAVTGDKLIDKAAEDGDKIINMDASNQASASPLLEAYPPVSAADMQNDINWGAKLLLPQRGDKAIGSYSFAGYEFRFAANQGVGAKVFGYVPSKGVLPCTGPLGALIPIAKAILQGLKPAEDPIDLAAGAFTLQQEDISIGSGDYQYKIEFERFYNSQDIYRDSILGFGWRHNFKIALEYLTEPTEQLLSGQAITKAAAIAGHYINHQVLKADNTNPTPNWITSSLSYTWLTDQITGKAVKLSLPQEDQIFVRQPDGSYEEPPKSRLKLTKVAGVFQAKTREGVIYNFDAASKKLTSIVYPYGMTLSLAYTAGKLTSVTNGLGRTLSFSYTGNYLSQVTDGTGRTVNYTVDASKNLTQVLDPDSKAWTFVYSVPGLLTQYFQPAFPTTAVVTNVYDSTNRIKEQRDPFNNLFSVYCAGPRVETVDQTNAAEATYFNQYGQVVKEKDALGFTTVNFLDGKGRQTKTVFPEGNSTEWTYNNLDLVTQIVYKAKPGSGLVDLSESFTYHPVWNKIQTHTDSMGRVWTWNYNAATGNLESLVQPTVNGQTPQESWTYNARGQVLTHVDETNITTQYNYHATDERLLSIVEDYGAGRLNLTTNFGHNARGDVTSVQNPRGFTTTLDFDLLRRLTQKTDPAPFSYVTKWTIDANGNITKVERQTGDVLNPWQTHQATFDAADLQRTATNPSNDVTTFDYTNRFQLWKITDAENRVTEYSYDELARLSTVKSPSLTTKETRTYTPNGRLGTVKDSRNFITTFTWDGFDRADKVIYPDSSYEQFQAYDPNSNVLTYRTRSGNTIVNTFDELNRLKTKAPQGQPTVTQEYDLAGRLKKLSTPVVVGNPASGDFLFDFDTAGRFFREISPDLKQVTFQLDANGNVSRLTYPDLYYVDRVYDELDRLTDIKLNGAATAAAHFDYDQLSRRTRLTFNNSTFVDYGFEKDDDLQSIAYSWNGSNATFGYTHNKIHQVTGQSFSDPLFQWEPSVLGTTTYATANNLNQYPQIGAVAQSYNGNGCLTGDGTFIYSFDTENHLITANASGVNASYLYDAQDRQVQKAVTTASTVKTNYIYSGWQRIADYDGASGALQNRYIYGDSLDEILIQVNSGGVLTYYYGDQLGSVVAQANSSGAVLNRYAYGPFGESNSLAGTTFGYTGQRVDHESGLAYYKHRHYSPATGRFLQPDPIGPDDEWNLYAYVGNEPLNFTDELGFGPGIRAEAIRRAIQAGQKYGPKIGRELQRVGKQASDTVNKLAKDAQTFIQKTRKKCDKGGANTSPTNPNKSGNPDFYGGSGKNAGLKTVRGDQAKMKADFENAGYKGEAIANKSGTEAGTKYSIPDASKKGGAKGNLEVRAMEGGPIHGKRTVVQRSNQYVRGDGTSYGNNAPSGAGHFPQD